MTNNKSCFSKCPRSHHHALMAGLFQPEPDEVEPSLFQDEPDESGEEVDAEQGGGLFKTEPDEPEEPDERDVQCGLFQNEDDEHDRCSDSDDMPYLADDEGLDATIPKGIVDMSFSTLNRFLSSQLCKTSDVAVEQPKKKRCYKNMKRLAKAASNRSRRSSQTSEKIPRNDIET